MRVIKIIVEKCKIGDYEYDNKECLVEINGITKIGYMQGGTIEVEDQYYTVPAGQDLDSITTTV